jgi:hypothetical protein
MKKLLALLSAAALLGLITGCPPVTTSAGGPPKGTPTSDPGARPGSGVLPGAPHDTGAHPTGKEGAAAKPAAKPKDKPESKSRTELVWPAAGKPSGKPEEKPADRPADRPGYGTVVPK